MAIRLLAILAEAATAPACLDAADAAGHAIGDAVIEALHVVVDPKHMVAAPEEIAIQQLRDRDEGTAIQREAATRAAYDDWVKAHPKANIPLRWKKKVGAEEENVAREARIFDVLVLARPSNMDGADALHAAIRKVGHPFFLMPAKRLAADATFAEHIVVAWNDTEQCRKALLGALPWLHVARDVTFLLIDEDRKVAGGAEKLLRLEHIPYRVHIVTRDEETLGDQIVTEARKLGADLLVMGVYRHSEFTEWLLGGTARHVLAHRNMPLLLAH